MNSRSSRSLRSYASRCLSFPVRSSHRAPLPIAVAVAAAVALSQSSQAATKTWNNAGTDWNTAGNWTGGLPAAADIALFDSTFANQPSLSGAGNAGAIWATTGLNQDVTIGGASILTLAGNLNVANGPGGLASTAILLNDSVNHNLTINAPITIANNTSFTNNSSGTLTISSLNQNNRVLSLTGNNVSGVIAIGGLTGTLNALTINTPGTVKLSGAAGATTLTAGTLDIGSGLTIGSSGSSTAAVGSIITTSTTGTSTLSHTVNNLLTLNSTLQDGAGGGKVLALSSTNGTLTLTGNNTYTGGTTATGALVLGSDTALGTGALTLNANTSVKSNSDTARSLANDVTSLGAVTFGSATPGETGNLAFGTLTKSGNASFTVNNAQTSFTGLHGVGPISKTGAGTLIIGNAVASTYTGSFTVSAGTLLISGDTSSMNGVSTVAAGATVGGTGTLGGNWTINGNLSPGTSPGTPSVEGSLTLASTAISTFEILSLASFDHVNVGTLLTYGGILNISLGFTPADGATFDLFDFASRSGTTTFSGINISDPNYSGTFNYTTGVLTLNTALVPEPSAIVLAAVGAGWLVWGRRRKFA